MCYTNKGPTATPTPVPGQRRWVEGPEQLMATLFFAQLSNMWKVQPSTSLAGNEASVGDLQSDSSMLYVPTFSH